MTYSGPWRVVRSLDVLNVQIRASAPRSVPPATPATAWGSIADSAHSTTSDHYPHRYASLGSVAVVCARDFPHAPDLGLDAGAVCEALRRSRDPRISYVIFNGRMFSSYSTSQYPAWTWRPYTGSDLHGTHFHVSSVHTALADDVTPWAIGADMALTTDERLTLDQILAIVRADRWQWVTDRASFIAAGGDPAVWDYAGGMGANTEATLLAQHGQALVKLGEGLSAVSQKLDELIEALTSGVEVNTKVELSPAGVQQVEAAAFKGAQRAESE